LGTWRLQLQFKRHKDVNTAASAVFTIKIGCVIIPSLTVQKAETL
jgi:hypothetical protein